MGIFCEINLHKSHDGVFVAGSKVEGVIRYAVDVETTFSQISVSLRGKGVLTIKRKHNDKSKEVTHCSSENYLDLKEVVTESDANVIPVGSYDIPFTFELPENIPPTFRHSSSNVQHSISCNIRYHVRIKFKRPGFWKFAKTYKKEVQVESGIAPRLPLSPIIYGKQKKLSILFSRKRSTITIKAGVAKSIIAPGDTLELEYEVKNDSNVTVRAIETKIVEVLKFTTKAKTVKRSRDVPHVECKTGSVKCDDSQTMRLLLDVPSDTRSLDFSGLVARDYFVQDTSSRRAAASLEGFQCHNNAVFDLAWAPSHMSFVTVSGDHTASLWDLAEGTPKRLLVFSNHTKSVKTAVFPPGTPSVFATGARDGHILLWDIRTNNQPNVVLKPDNCLMNCHSSFTPKTPGSHGKRNRLDTNRALSITGLAFQDDLTLLSCGECDGNIKVWDLRKNYNIYKREPLPKHSIPYCGNSAKNGYTNLVIDEARVRLYASCMDDVIYCFNLAAYSAVPEQRYSGHENGTFYIKAGLSPDGLYLVSGSSDTHAYIWNVKCPEPVVRLVGHRTEVTCAAWCRRGDTKLVTCSDDARHNIWRIGPELPPPPGADLAARAELVPRANLAARPHWGLCDRTPTSLKRKHASTPASSGSKRSAPGKRPADPARRTKRCLADLMNASKRSEAEEAEVLVKRLRLDSSARPESAEWEGSPPVDWGYLPPAPGTSFMSPTKNYRPKRGTLPSPQMSDTHVATSPPLRYAERTSPAKLRIITFTTPTKNLPDFVADGEAPHLRLMSPAKKRRAPTDWLTRIAREKRARPDGAGTPAAPPDPTAPAAPTAPSVPARRNSNADKPPKTKTSGARTLLTYFSVDNAHRQVKNSSKCRECHEQQL